MPAAVMLVTRDHFSESGRFGVMGRSLGYAQQFCENERTGGLDPGASG